MPSFRTKETPHLRLGMSLEDILIIEDLNTGNIFEATALEVMMKYRGNRYFSIFNNEEIIFIDWAN